MDVLKIDKVSKSFGSHQILKNLSFHVSEHSVYGFIGCNGAGKTTTMKLILGLYQADSGTIDVCGHRVKYGQTDTNRFIGYLPDVPEFYTYMTPYEYLDLCADITNMPLAGRKKKIQNLLMMTGLEKHTKRINGFSRGMKQRLGIAQALLNEPELLICDEPTSALDPVGRKEILDILTSVKDKTTVLFSTHILSDIERVCDHIGFLKDGAVVYESSMDEIRNNQSAHGFYAEFACESDCSNFRRLYSRISSESETEHQTKLVFKKSDTKQMLEALDIMSENNICPVTVQRIEPDLEDLFMEVIR